MFIDRYGIKSSSRTGSETYTVPEPGQQSRNLVISIELSGRKSSSFPFAQESPLRGLPPM
jgi:hypothetical protein